MKEKNLPLILLWWEIIKAFLLFCSVLFCLCWAWLRHHSAFKKPLSECRAGAFQLGHHTPRGSKEPLQRPQSRLQSWWGPGPSNLSHSQACSSAWDSDTLGFPRTCFLNKELRGWSRTILKSGSLSFLYLGNTEELPVTPLPSPLKKKNKHPKLLQHMLQHSQHLQIFFSGSVDKGT